jgi:hypothetical protein
MSRTYRAEIVTDEAADAPAAVVIYSISHYSPASWNGPGEGEEIEIESIRPPSYEITDADEKFLRRNARYEDFVEARS